MSKKSERVQVGRTVRTLPSGTPAGSLAARVAKNAALSAEVRAVTEAEARRARKEEIAAHLVVCQDLWYERAVEAKGRGNEVSELDYIKGANVIANKHADWVRRGKVLAGFPIYDVIAEELHRIGASAVAPSRDTGTLDAHLPPPASPGRKPLHAGPADPDAARREEQFRAGQERGRQQAEKVRQDRDAYQAALKKHGLADPTMGCPARAEDWVTNSGGLVAASSDVVRGRGALADRHRTPSRGAPTSLSSDCFAPTRSFGSAGSPGRTLPTLPPASNFSRPVTDGH